MATSDQALSFHEVDPWCYELSGLRTGSVRDQILRAQLLVERLLKLKDLPPHPLLVLGGGAAGVTAALTAISLGRDVVIVEKGVNPFTTQLGVSTRKLNPTEFDWPQPHWRAGTMAWGGSKYALPYSTDWANRLANDWLFVWRSVVGPSARPLPAGVGKIEFHRNTDANRIILDRSKSAGVLVKAWPGVQPSSTTFCAAISCIGFSGEKTSVSSTSGSEMVGRPFWKPDQLHRSTLGVHSMPGTRIKVLISGGGDGAQQDFLRALTGTFGTDLFDRLKLGGLKLDLVDAVLAEDAARRAHAWSTPGVRPSQAYLRWNAEYERLADQVEAAWKGDAVELNRVRSLLRPHVDATWLMSGASPDYSYGLNRLLAILVARLHSGISGRPRQTGPQAGYAPTGTECVLYGFKLDKVMAVTPHPCDDSCYDQDHVAVVRANDPTVAGGTHRLGVYNLLVLRHGVDQKPYFKRPPVTEQLTPFDRPN